MASQARFELTTFPLGGGCSIQLSYWDKSGGSMLTRLGLFVMPLRSMELHIQTTLPARAFAFCTTPK